MQRRGNERGLARRTAPGGSEGLAAMRGENQFALSREGRRVMRGTDRRRVYGSAFDCRCAGAHGIQARPRGDGNRCRGRRARLRMAAGRARCGPHYL